MRNDRVELMLSIINSALEKGKPVKIDVEHVFNTRAVLHGLVTKIDNLPNIRLHFTRDDEWTQRVWLNDVELDRLSLKNINGVVTIISLDDKKKDAEVTEAIEDDFTLQGQLLISMIDKALKKGTEVQLHIGKLDGLTQNAYGMLDKMQVQDDTIILFYSEEDIYPHTFQRKFWLTPAEIEHVSLKHQDGKLVIVSKDDVVNEETDPYADFIAALPIEVSMMRRLVSASFKSNGLPVMLVDKMIGAEADGLVVGRIRGYGVDLAHNSLVLNVEELHKEETETPNRFEFFYTPEDLDGCELGKSPDGNQRWFIIRRK